MDKKTVTTICYLARLKIDKEKAQKIENDLEAIIELISELQNIDTSNVEPLYNPLEKTALKHNDVIDSDNQKEKFLDNAPSSNEDYFLVPRVVE
jgi:aspartyl-tRNA(Asn)/glutamyl-tRNA(Gln) amidotransferase subunit C|tara:strand:- start:567 stop:848 length:282 start_codon:yes stop_codon:yes gene_type:complete